MAHAKQHNARMQRSDHRYVDNYPPAAADCTVSAIVDDVGPSNS